MKIAQAQARELHAWQQKLRESRAALSADFEQYLQALGDLTGQFNLAVMAHNDRLGIALKFVETVADDLRDTWDGKSERWQESDAGQDAEAMVEDWEDARLEPLDRVQLLLPDTPYFKESLNLPEESE